MENDPTRVLIIDTAWVGDVVFTTALTQAVRQLWPDARLALLVSPRAAGVVKEHPTIDEVIVYDKVGHERGLGALLELGGRLRANKFDLVLCAHTSLRSAMVARLTRAPVRVGWEAPWARLCFTHTCPNDLALEPYHVGRRLNLLKALRVSVDDPGVHVPVSSETDEWAGRFLEGAQISRPLLGLVPGSAWATKRWPAAKFRQLATTAREELRAQCIVFAVEQDATLVAKIVRDVDPAPIAVLGKSLEQVAALLSKCRWVVGNDTGISYLAIGVKGPAVRVLYGSTQVNFRFLPPHRAITAGIPCCSARTGHGKQSCSWGDPPVCMDAIEPREVLESLVANG